MGIVLEQMLGDTNFYVDRYARLKGFNTFPSMLKVVQTSLKPQILELACAYIDFGLANPKNYHLMYKLFADELECYPKEYYGKNSITMFRILEDAMDAEHADKIKIKDDPRVLLNVETVMLRDIVSLMITKGLRLNLDKEKVIDKKLDQIVPIYTHLPD